MGTSVNKGGRAGPWRKMMIVSCEKARAKPVFDPARTASKTKHRGAYENSKPKMILPASLTRESDRA